MAEGKVIRRQQETRQSDCPTGSFLASFFLGFLLNFDCLHDQLSHVVVRCGPIGVTVDHDDR
jgi:hypothetical protein